MLRIAAAHKTGFLQDQCSIPFVTRMVNVFRGAVAHLPASSIPEGVWNSLELDLVYCICRHRTWINCSLLDSICTEFLVSDYQINRDLAEQLVGELMHGARRVQNNEEKIDDREFLKYIFVLASMSKNENDLTDDLGIGYDLIRRLKTATENVIADGSETVTFLPEVDSMFGDIILNISKELKNTPWILSVYYLKYEFGSIPESLDMVVEENSFDWLFETLLYLASNSECNFETLLKKTNEYCIENSLDILEAEEFKEVLGHLSRKGFLFKSGSGPRGPIYQASEKSQFLAAEAFATKFTKAPTLGALKGLNKHFQIAMVKKLGGSRAHMGLEILKKSPYPLSPQTIPVLVSQLKSDIDQNRLVELLAKHGRSLQPWIRKAVCSAAFELSDLSSSSTALELIRKFATKDSSDSVRDFALALMSGKMTSGTEKDWIRIFASHEESVR